jgi:hypothetical protein
MSPIERVFDAITVLIIGKIIAPAIDADHAIAKSLKVVADPVDIIRPNAFRNECLLT